MHSLFSRRAAMLGAAALPLVRAVKGQARPRNIVISSGNGVRACAKAMEVIRAGGDTLDEANDVLGSDVHHYPPVYSRQ